MRKDQRWYIAGAAGAVLLLLAGWFMLISPQNSSTADVQAQTQSAQAANFANQVTLRRLAKENENLSDLKAELDKLKLALPAQDDLTELIRELEAASSATGVQITGHTFGQPTALSNKAGAGSGSSDPRTGGATYSISVSLTASGSLPQLQAFLDKLQNQMPRTVLIDSASIKSGDAGGGDSLQVTLQVFVDPSTGTKGS